MTGRLLPRTVAMSVVALVAACGTSADPAIPEQSETTGPALVRVPQDAPTISAALESVREGGMVLISPGTYPEEVTIDTPDVTLRGTDRNAVIIDGGGERSFGVFASADGVRIENLTVRSTLFYGVLVTGMHDESGPLAHGGPGYTELDPSDFPPVERFSISHVTAYNNGLYGIYAFNAQHGSIADSYASGSADSGFYVGQCEKCDILVASNVAERNAIGFENANASDSVVVAGNRWSGNRIGMTLISNYQEAFTPQRNNTVAGNLISHNSSADSPAHALGGFGVGLSINGGQGNHVVGNRIEDNPIAGLVLTNAEDIPAADNEFIANTMSGNGLDVTDVSSGRTPSRANCFEGNEASTSAPATILKADCATQQAPSAGAGTLPVVPVPDGLSFLDVPAPPDQPALADVDAAPDPLPATVDLPPASTFPLPDPMMLSERAATA